MTPHKTFRPASLVVTFRRAAHVITLRRTARVVTLRRAACVITLRRAACAVLLVALAAACGCAPAGTSQNLARQGVASGPPQNAATPQAATTAERPSPQAKTEGPLPRPAGHVSDFAKVIDEPTRLRLEERFRKLKEETGVEFAVVTVDTTGGRDISDYSLEVARGWGIGPAPGARGGGLLLLVAVNDRNWRVQVSRSLEAALPNATVKEIGYRMARHFRNGDFGRGISNYAEELIARLPADAKARAAEPGR